MSGETTSTTLAGLYTAIQQTALFTMQEKAFMRPLVRNYNLIGQPGKAAHVGIYPTVDTSSLVSGEGTDATNIAITATEKTFTATEVAALATLTDTARDSANDDTAASIGRILGETLAKKVDEDIAALFTGFSTSATVVAGTSELTPDDILAAIAILRANSVTGPYVGVFHPYQTYNLRKVLANAGAATVPSLSNAGNEVLTNGYIGRLFGVDIFESSVVTGTSAGAYVGAIMHPDALAFCLKKDLTIETQRDASLRATEIVASMTYAVGELFDAHGVKIITDASITN
jgi:N4-gp56 family major capsid protein